MSTEGPYATAQAALDAGRDFARQDIEPRGGMVTVIDAFKQPGGYWCRVTWTMPSRRGGRASRRHRQVHRTEIGRVAGGN